jgi:hypothetical protein
LPPSFARLDPATLAPASGRQDHTTSPSAHAFRKSHSTGLVPVRRSFSEGGSAPPVLRRRCVHRIPPRVRDDAYAPLVEARRREEYSISDFPKEKYFSQEDWTTQITLNRFNKLQFRRSAFSTPQGRASEARAGTIQLIRPSGDAAGRSGAKGTNFRIALSYLSMSAAYLGTIEPSISVVLVWHPIGKADCRRQNVHDPNRAGRAQSQCLCCVLAICGQTAAFMSLPRSKLSLQVEFCKSSLQVEFELLGALVLVPT